MLDIKTIESWLWDGVCSIRGAVDAPKFKDYILPLIFIKCISDVFEGLPDLSGSNDFSVRFKIPAQVKDKNFILFIEKITREKQITLSFDEIYKLEKISEHQPVTEIEYKRKFLDIGIIERVGKTRGAKYILSHKYYTHAGKIGEHTRIVGLEREQKKDTDFKPLKEK